VQVAYEPPKNCVALTRYFYPPSERSEDVLRDQLLEAEQLVSRWVTGHLQPYQREALLCLVSDLAAGLVTSPTLVPFEKSFLVTALNRGMYQIAAAEFHVFCYVNHRLSPRAWEKRKAEQYLFSRGHLLFE
jgi:GH24 family phage-related lysozyme (muramidase)